MQIMQVKRRSHKFILHNFLIVLSQQRRLDTITCAQEVGVLPHVKHYTKPKSRSNALAAVLDAKVC